MAACAFCGTWLSKEYERVNGGKYGVLCVPCGGPGPEFKPETAYNERPGTIPQYREGEMADDERADPLGEYDA